MKTARFLYCSMHPFSQPNSGMLNFHTKFAKQIFFKFNATYREVGNVFSTTTFEKEGEKYRQYLSAFLSLIRFTTLNQLWTTKGMNAIHSPELITIKPLEIK
jgi:uncharacterized protein YbgA (DUF1722 family)